MITRPHIILIIVLLTTLIIISALNGAPLLTEP